MPTGRIVAFRMYHGDRSVVEGKFFVVAEEGVACFGEYRNVQLGGGAEAPVFEGAVIRHSLEADGGAVLEIDLYSVDESGRTPKQYRVLRAGVSMGCEAGETGSESVMLGNMHEFVYETQMVA